MLWPIGFVLLTMACEPKDVAEAPEPFEPSEPATNAAKVEGPMTPCERSLNIFVAPLQDEVPTATLRFSSANNGELQCADVLVGEKQVRLMPGESTTITAHPKELHRVYIRNQRLLVHIAPGSTIEFGGHPEHEWELRDDRFIQKEGLIPGQVWLSPPSAWTEPITVEASPEDPTPFPGIVDPPLALVPAPFPNVRVNTGNERVRLAIGNGEQWILEVNAEGGLTGSLK
jgi:hypothetical protein